MAGKTNEPVRATAYLPHPTSPSFHPLPPIYSLLYHTHPSSPMYRPSPHTLISLPSPLDFKMVKGASAKRSTPPRRASVKKHPVSPWAAYRAASTHPESPYWRQGVILPQEPLDLFGEPLLIVTMGQPKWHTGPAPLLPPDHYGCGLGSNCFTGTLAAVQEHECGCAHAIERLLPEGLDRDILNSNEDELALTLLDIVEPLQYPLSLL